MSEPGKDYLKPMTPQWHARQRNHRHNGYTGHARMMQMQARAIIDSDTTSLRAKQAAAIIYSTAIDLASALKERIDP